MRYSIPLQANIPTQQPLRGKCIVILSTGLAAGVDMTLLRGSEQNEDHFGEVPRNFSVFDADGGGFMGVIFTATVATTVEVIVTNYDARSRAGDAVTATIDAGQLPLPVAASRGDVPGNPLFVSGLTLDETPAASNANAAAVAVGPAAAIVAAAAANVLERRFSNIGDQPFALGAVGLTWAQRCVVLNPGDTWVEVKGAALAWYAITDAGGASSCTVQELRS